MAQATVKAGVKPGAGLTFFCSQHGPNMNGSLLVPGGTADDKTDLAYVFKSIERNVPALNSQPVPGTPINPSPSASVEIDGDFASGKPTWLVGGKPASDVAIKPGDTIVWKALKGTHGVVFNTQAAAKGVLQFQTGGSLPPLEPVVVQGENVWGTKPQPAGTVLAQATVKKDVRAVTTLGFFCSQHGRAMSGLLDAAFFAFPPYVVKPSTATEKGGVEPTDPFTPLLRVYANDQVEVRVLVGRTPSRTRSRSRV